MLATLKMKRLAAQNDDVGLEKAMRVELAKLGASPETLGEHLDAGTREGITEAMISWIERASAARAEKNRPRIPADLADQLAVAVEAARTNKDNEIRE